MRSPGRARNFSGYSGKGRTNSVPPRKRPLRPLHQSWTQRRGMLLPSGFHTALHPGHLRIFQNRGQRQGEKAPPTAKQPRMSPTLPAQNSGTMRAMPAETPWGPQEAAEGPERGILDPQDHLHGIESCHDACWTAVRPHLPARSPLAEQLDFDGLTAGAYSIWGLPDTQDCSLPEVIERSEGCKRRKPMVCHLSSLSEASDTAVVHGPDELTSLANKPGVLHSINSFAETRLSFRARDSEGSLLLADKPFADPTELVTFVTMLAWNRDMLQESPEAQYTYILLHELHYLCGHKGSFVARFVDAALNTVHGRWSQKDEYLRQFLANQAARGA